MQFLIPSEMAPGVYRAGVGFFEPGQVLTLPDAASKEGDVLPSKLVPLDKDAHAALVKQHGAKAKPIGGVPAPKPKAKDDALTVAQAAERHGGGGRAADK